MAAGRFSTRPARELRCLRSSDECESPAAAVTIPAGTIVRTQEVTEPVRLQLLAPVAIAAGASPPSACVEEELPPDRIKEAFHSGVPVLPAALVRRADVGSSSARELPSLPRSCHRRSAASKRLDEK